MSWLPKVILHTDISYLEDGLAEKLDAYLPPERFRRPCPAVLLMHGGSWQMGDKADERERNIGATLASCGYAVFSINYLLNKCDEVVAPPPARIAWPRNLYDCKSALRFLRREAMRFGIDPLRIGAMGGSAGGHLAMLLGFTAHDEEVNQHGLYIGESNAVSCIVNLYGVPDVREQFASYFAGRTEEESRKHAQEASPLVLLEGIRPPPLFIAHGTADMAVPVAASRRLVERLQEIGADYEYVEIQGAPHSFHLQPEQIDLRPMVLEFLQKHMGGGD